QGMRNPTLVVPAGTTLKILFVNVDDDMNHDVRFGHVVGDFPIAPETAETAGSTRLLHKSEDDMIQAEEIVIKADSEGLFKYFCSVRGHAKGGMWGNIAVGVGPDDKMKMPTKPSDADMKDMPGMKPDQPMNMPVKKPGDETSMKSEM